jgi:hypothetical protein
LEDTLLLRHGEDIKFQFLKKGQPGHEYYLHCLKQNPDSSSNGGLNRKRKSRFDQRAAATGPPSSKPKSVSLFPYEFVFFL